MIEVHAPIGDKQPSSCLGCGGTKEAPIATIASIYHHDLGVTLALCEVCARDLANAVGFFCIRDGGWSKLEPRKRVAQKKMDQALPQAAKRNAR